MFIRSREIERETTMIMEACFIKSMSLTTTQTSSKAKIRIFYGRKINAFPRRNGAISPPINISSCHLSSPMPNNDDREPMIDRDWRSFRARLVSGEQASRTEEPATWLAVDEARGNNPPPVKLSGKWAHSLHEPEHGCLLIATEKLDGVHIFERTVILLLSTGPVGPMGIILNRPSLMSIKETRSTDLDVAGIFSDRPLFFGGPLEEGLFLVGPQNGGDDQVGRSGVFDEVMKGLYYGTKESVGCAAEMVKRNVIGLGDFRFFDGYCGWEKDQLKEEIRTGYWNVAACSPNVIGLSNVGSAGLWEEILGLMGERKVW